MQYTALVTRILLSFLGVVLIILGVLFWTGHALSLLPLHLLIGGLFVVCLWVLVVLAFVVRAGRGFALLVFAWSLVVPAFGVAQVQLVPGSLHWVIQALHLAVGLIAIGLGHGLARAISQGLSVSRTAPEHG